MRIIIDVDGENVSMTTESAPLSEAMAGIAAVPRGAKPTPPPELLKAAAALGAQDAGPAPVARHVPGPVKAAVSFAESGGKTDAGQAPVGPAKSYPAKKAPAAPKVAGGAKKS
jgi:hypothetical protein